MSAGLRDLLFHMRQHPAFQELISAMAAPAVKPFVPSKSGVAEAQTAEWIFRSGCNAQHARWVEFLVEFDPQTDSSQQENR